MYDAKEAIRFVRQCQTDLKGEVEVEAEVEEHIENERAEEQKRWKKKRKENGMTIDLMTCLLDSYDTVLPDLTVAVRQELRSRLALPSFPV